MALSYIKAFLKKKRKGQCRNEYRKNILKYQKNKTFSQIMSDSCVIDNNRTQYFKDFG